MESTNNGKMDIDGLLETSYGEVLTKMLELRYTYETDPMGEACLEYYEKMGVKKEMFDRENFYNRWVLFSPNEDLGEHRLPLILWCHGGKEVIEEEEFATNLTRLVNREKILVAMPQNTNSEFQAYIIEEVAKRYRLDRERVYTAGFSQGSKAAAAAMLRMPEKLAGAALCSGPAFDTKDNKNVPFTIEEAERLKEVFVPYMQMNNQYDAGNYVPVNEYTPRRKTEPVENHIHPDPNYSISEDPTRDPGGGKAAVRISPPENYDVHKWLMGRLNLRLFLQGCAPRNEARCLAFRDDPEDELHHALGFYGDWERTANILGVKHYFADIMNENGLDAFRYVVIANTNHWPPVTAAELIWDYFRQFRRDSATGRILADEYTYRGGK